MLGDYSSDVGGVVIFIFAILISIMFFTTTMIKVKAEIKNVQEELDVVDMAHLVRMCLERNGVIESEFLEGNDGRGFAEFSGGGVCEGKDPFVSITDLEGDGEWSFGKVGGKGHQVFVSLLVDGDTHVGRLHVAV